MLNNPKVDVVNINACAKFGQIRLFILKILSDNEILTSFKGHNSVLKWEKLMLNNPNLDVININAQTKFGQNPFLLSQDIERKWNSDIIQGP